MSNRQLLVGIRYQKELYQFTGNNYNIVLCLFAPVRFGRKAHFGNHIPLDIILKEQSIMKYSDAIKKFDEK